jgi:putative phosphoribosyl transferase
MLFHDRRNAGILLANKISQISLDKNNTIVIALPRGGVPVAYEVAKKLQVPLDEKNWCSFISRIGSGSSQ